MAIQLKVNLLKVAPFPLKKIREKKTALHPALKPTVLLASSTSISTKLLAATACSTTTDFTKRTGRVFYEEKAYL